VEIVTPKVQRRLLSVRKQRASEDPHGGITKIKMELIQRIDRIED
jgi:hypothetical protein